MLDHQFIIKYMNECKNISSIFLEMQYIHVNTVMLHLCNCMRHTPFCFSMIGFPFQEVKIRFSGLEERKMNGLMSVNAYHNALFPIMQENVLLWFLGTIYFAFKYFPSLNFLLSYLHAKHNIVCLHKNYLFYFQLFL